MAERMIEAYLGDDHLADRRGQYPMIALSSEIARAAPEVQERYGRLLSTMISLLATDGDEGDDTARERAMAVAALSVGGMILAQTLPESELAADVRRAALAMARQAGSDARADAGGGGIT
ncbi:hypothetical protein [Algicella marina]|uniref:Uncharacterized protein n=1 Tax=Algicella marina TaxID=2683284 RepID=A0A6P1T2H6_9RHOB|nr:hypothetical protein [Algicella marina]QHQ35955.1 hypothetical protein GO499_12635 [Algicella marina]